ncbi:MAG: DEAD/DEAH box helicase [candidate division Zixibacteria bacterium]|nr:DEAD/DEAH box helicase [candidate division Zixibacteria bacterium]
MLGEIKDVTDYLRTYGATLVEKIKQTAEPIFNPGDKWDGKLHTLLRKPYQAQGDAIMGLSNLLRDYDSAIVVGEMGCGKSLIGASVPYVYNNDGRPARTLVMCPGHLVKKWQREILETIPDAEANIVRHLKDLLSLDTNQPDHPEYVIVSKDRAKLGYAWKPAVLSKNGNYHCPDCFGQILDKDETPATEEYFKSSKRWCPACDAPLWEADGCKMRRYALSDYIKKYLKGYFDFFVADEVHELKGGASAQGNSFGALSSACGKTVALTGTLLGGYADDIYYVLYRLSPHTIKREDIEYEEVSKWMAKYGVLERITKSRPEDNLCSKGKRKYSILKRKPGISPMIFSKHLLDKTVFLSLEDIAPDLPPISEEVIRISMDEELQDAYGALQDTLSAAVKSALSRGSKALLSTYLNALLAYPDRPFDNGPILFPQTEKVVATPINLPKDKVYNKERKLIDLVKGEVSQGRKVFTYCQYTGLKDVTSRLERLLFDEGINTDILRYSVDPEAREDWIHDKVKSGVQVVLANPKLVQTGLDLYDFPTLVFYQTGYSVFTLRQASRRSWRIGQDKDVKVYYLFYESTMQEKALQLMGSKLEASLAIEGKFSEEGLLAMTAGEDVSTEMAKALLEGLEIDGVEQVWSKLNKSNVPAPKEEIVQNKLFYVNPASYLTRRTRKKARYDPNQLLLPGF